jgi:hypothetical protein
MFHERGAEAAGSHEETRRIAANIAEAAEAVARKSSLDSTEFTLQNMWASFATLFFAS